MYEVISAKKSNLTNETKVREALAKMRPDWIVENVKEAGNDEWLVRLFKEEKTADGPPDFLKKKDEGDVAPSDDADVVDDEDDVDTEDDEDDDGDKKDKGKKDESKDLVSELKDLQSQLSDVLQQVQDKADEVSGQAEEHKNKLDEAQSVLGDPEGGPMGGPPMPSDGPTPGGMPPGSPPPGGLPGGPPMGGKPPMPPRRPGVPGGGAPHPGLPSSFTKRKTEVVQHPGVNAAGERISLTAAAATLEHDAEFSAYEVVGMVENADGSYSAKLKLK